MAKNVKKVLVVTLLGLALSAGVASAEKSDTPTLDCLRALMNDPPFKNVSPASSQMEIFQSVMESYVPRLKELDFFYRQCLVIKLRLWLEKNKNGVPDGHARGEWCLPAQDVLMKKYGPARSR